MTENDTLQRILNDTRDTRENRHLRLARLFRRLHKYYKATDQIREPALTPTQATRLFNQSLATILNEDTLTIKPIRWHVMVLMTPVMVRYLPAARVAIYAETILHAAEKSHMFEPRPGKETMNRTAAFDVLHTIRTMAGYDPDITGKRIITEGRIDPRFKFWDAKHEKRFSKLIPLLPKLPPEPSVKEARKLG